VDLELTIAADGSVADAHVLNGPQELRRAALLAVLQWQFLEEAALAKVSVEFRMPAVDASKPKIGGIRVDGSLSTELKAAIEGRLRAFKGQPASPALTEEARLLILALHPDLQISEEYLRSEGGMVELSVWANRALHSGSEDRIRVAASEQKKRLISQGNLVYPPLARQARIQDTVRFEMLVGKDGLVKNLSVESGHPLLVPAALEAVKGNRYQPAIRAGQPIEVLSSIDVVFRLIDPQ
jgi:TonB family protein